MSKNKYIGIETIPRELLLTNYGSIFQHYALRHVLKEFGFVPFRCEKDACYVERGFLTFPFHLLRLFVVGMVRCDITAAKKYFQARCQRFKFLRDYWHLIGSVFERQRNHCTCAYIAGGDSVWCCTEERNFLLDKDSAIRRISYAASSAWDKFVTDKVWRERIKEVVRTFAAIGVRENAGEVAIKGIVPNVPISIVLDPVFLLPQDHWNEIINDFHLQFGKPTLLYYAVNVWNKESLNLEAVEMAAARLGCGLRVVGIQGAQDYIPPVCADRPSPRKFMAMLRDSKYVVTNSFHGIVFSIIFRKRFVFIPQSGRRYGNQNCRQMELLNRFSLGVYSTSVCPQEGEIEKGLRRPIDYDAVTHELEQERAKCRMWLMEALNGPC